MAKQHEIKINGYNIYIENLEQMDEAPNMHDAFGKKSTVFEWTTQNLEQTMKPMLNIMESLRNAASELIPDEMELATQFNITLKGETPVLKIVSAETAAQMSVKFVWKNEKK